MQGKQKTGTNTCSSSWYYNYWGYYWGRLWHTGPIGTVHVNGVGCREWRVVLAFSFIALWLYLMSGILVSAKTPHFQAYKKRNNIHLGNLCLSYLHQAQ
jgi:hypothetical protein